MNDNLSVIQKLDRIRDVLTHPAIDHAEIVRRVRSVFRDAKYQKRPIIYRTEAVIRASKRDDEAWFDHVNKFSYPPNALLNNYGRCNCPGEPIFYCSSENAVPIFEIRPSVNDFVAVSHWGTGLVAKNLEFYILPVGTKAIIDHLPEDDQLRNVLLQEDIFREDTPQDIKDIDEYIGRLFFEDANNYKNLYWFTYAITNAVLGLTFTKSGKKIDGQKLDGIMYPSVASKLSGFNLALTKEYVDKNLKLVAAGMWKVVSIDNIKFEYKLEPLKNLNRPNAKGDNLTWNKTKLKTLLEFSPETQAQTFDPEKSLPLEG